MHAIEKKGEAIFSLNRPQKISLTLLFYIIYIKSSITILETSLSSVIRNNTTLNRNSNKSCTTDMYKENAMMATTSTSPYKGVSSAVSTTPGSLPTSDHDLKNVYGLKDEGINDVDLDNGEDEHTIDNNDSNGDVENMDRSTSSAEGRSTAGDNSSMFFRREGLASKETRTVDNLKFL
jgi:hypothetical protein